MDDTNTIKTAGMHDCGRLADFRIRFVQNRYQGYLPSDTLTDLNRDSIKHELQQWLREGYVLDCMEIEGQINGLIAYRADPLTHEGWIQLAEILAPADTEHKFALIDHAVDEMRQRGCSQVYLWLLKDNFRARFLFQHYGFREDNTMRTISRQGYSLVQVRYSLPQKT